MIHLRSAEIGRIPASDEDTFPFSIPLVRNRTRIPFDAPVTIVVGENGTGKSTLIEALAYAVDARAIGSVAIDEDETLAAVRRLGKAMRLVWSMRTKEGFFLRAEDFFGFVKRIERVKAELRIEEKQLAEEMEGRSDFAMQLALGPLRKELGALKRMYGAGLDTMSHGESFLKLFQSRLRPNGLYLLDEPETPLSPLRQFSLISQIREMERHNCQFIIATHSPILMAYPDASILVIKDGVVETAAYDDLEHVQLTRDFLNNPDQFLRHL